MVLTPRPTGLASPARLIAKIRPSELGGGLDVQGGGSR
jgi:hypothetical protein